MNDLLLWLLRPRDSVVNLPSSADNPWEPWYDKTFGFVVRAATEERAREIAESERGAEHSGAWLDSRYSTCEVLTAAGVEGLVIEDNRQA
jgi:hypothetical protein